MQIKVVDLKGHAAGEAVLSPDFFSVDPKLDVISEVIRWQLAARQTGSHQVKNRSAVHGTTKKAFKQKGTGRARRGAWTTNICRGGGVGFGPVVRSHAFKLNKKVRQLALKGALSLKFKKGDLVILSDLDCAHSKTKDIRKDLVGLGVNSGLFVFGENNPIDNFSNAVTNLPWIDLMSIRGLNVYDIMGKEKLVLTKDALQCLQNRCGGKDVRSI